VAEPLCLSVAMEVMLLPVWIGAVAVRPMRSLGRRGALAMGPIAGLGVALAGLASGGGGPTAAAVIRSQAVVLAFAVLLGGMALLVDRLAGPRTAQFLTAVLGWILVAAIILAGPFVGMLHGPVQAVLVRAIAHTNPLLVGEAELGVGWLHQALTYRWTPLGESYNYLFGDLAWWKTVLAYLFVGSGLAVFSQRGRSGPGPEDLG